MEHPIRQVRKQRGLSLRELAAMAQMDHSTIAKIEQRKRQGDLSTFKRLGKVLKMDFRLLIED